ncbi:MAG: hypothetical protein AVDCRST_MAG47-1237, partial [uncultured Nocardioidaceae bacterium]
ERSHHPRRGRRRRDPGDRRARPRGHGWLDRAVGRPWSRRAEAREGAPARRGAARRDDAGDGRPDDVQPDAGGPGAAGHPGGAADGEGAGRPRPGLGLAPGGRGHPQAVQPRHAHRPDRRARRRAPAAGSPRPEAAALRL